jgi:hypothetical protein
MNDRGHPRHSVLREGVMTGLIGAAIVAVSFLIYDLVGGRPLQTPNTLGKIIFRADLAPGSREILPGVVAGYTVVHLALFALVGIGLAFLAHLTNRNITLRMGVWMGLVITFAFFAGLMLMLSTATGERLSIWAVLLGNFLAVAGMKSYLWRRYPGLGRSFERAPLGSEVRPPPHPPEA